MNHTWPPDITGTFTHSPRSHGLPHRRCHVEGWHLCCLNAMIPSSHTSVGPVTAQSLMAAQSQEHTRHSLDTHAGAVQPGGHT